MFILLEEENNALIDQGTEGMAGRTDSWEACSEGIEATEKSLGDRTYESPQYLLQ